MISYEALERELQAWEPRGLRAAAMTFQATILLFFYFGVLLLITKPLGAYLARVFEGERTFLQGGLGWLERGTYRALGVDPTEDMKWTTYSVAML
jgi:K+-transporting ATPase ATPase A chain